MKQSEALKQLYCWDKQGRYVFCKSDLEIVFAERGRTLDQTVVRLVKAGILERAAHGIYIFALSAHIGSATLELVARNLRRGEFTFESLESALSKWGVISQVPIDRITLMTTGRSGEYKTPYGVIEFTHTKAPIEDIVVNTVVRTDEHALPIATKQYAYKNLRSVGRNLNLVDKGELDG
jgi:predicted transcriptional regulator of viral defense system